MEEYTCEECGKKFKIWNKKTYNGIELIHGYYSHRFCSLNCSNTHRDRILSIYAKNRCDKGEFGGMNNETYKKHKHGWCRGLYCGSSWELAFVLYYTDLGKSVKRCSLKLPYVYLG